MTLTGRVACPSTLVCCGRCYLYYLSIFIYVVLAFVICFACVIFAMYPTTINRGISLWFILDYDPSLCIDFIQILSAILAWLTDKNSYIHPNLHSRHYINSEVLILKTHFCFQNPSLFSSMLAINFSLLECSWILICQMEQKKEPTVRVTG